MTAELSATELLAAYRDGSLSPVEVARDALDRVAAVNDAVNAYCFVDPDRTLADAAAAEKRWRAGEPEGLLDGVPVSIKDILLSRGWPTLRGSHTVDPDQPWDADAPAVARLREHNAVLVGKTTTPELGWKGVTDSPLTGITRNPWEVSKTAGGSSGGAAAAVAAGTSPISIGTDGGGSIRIPASFSGVFGIKPTYGLVPLFPASPYGTLAHVGPLSWTVRDSAIALDVLSGSDSRDWTTGPRPERPMTANLRAGVDGMRIAYSPRLGFATVDPEVDAIVREAAHVFADLGARVELVDPAISDPVLAFHVLWFAGAAASIVSLTDAQRAQLDPGLLAACEEGASRSALDYVAATAVRAELGRIMGEFHQHFDLLLTPTMPIPAFEAGVEVPPGSPHERWTGWTPFTYPFNMTQQPAASLPCGFTAAGLPVGLQVVGPKHADARVLTACHAFEEARPWQGSRPALG